MLTLLTSRSPSDKRSTVPLLSATPLRRSRAMLTQQVDLNMLQYLTTPPLSGWPQPTTALMTISQMLILPIVVPSPPVLSTIQTAPQPTTPKPRLTPQHMLSVSRKTSMQDIPRHCVSNARTLLQAQSRSIVGFSHRTEIVPHSL